MCKHFHRRYASKWFVWIGGTIYINIEKKDESEFAPPLEFNIFKNIQRCSERELIYFFHQFVWVICTHSMAVYIYETWTDSSIKISQKTCIFLDSFQMGNIKRNFKQYINMRSMHDQINRKEKAGIQKKYEWNKCTQRRRIK